MSYNQLWLQAVSLRDLLEEELWWRNERLRTSSQETMPMITLIQEEITRRITKG